MILNFATAHIFNLTSTVNILAPNKLTNDAPKLFNNIFFSGGDPKLWHIGNDQSVIKKVVPKEVDIPVTYPCMHCANWFLMYL